MEISDAMGYKATLDAIDMVKWEPKFFKEGIKMEIKYDPLLEGRNLTDPVDVLGDSISSLRIIDWVGTDLSIVNSARCSFGKRKTEIDDSDVKLIKYLLKHDHGSPLEHNSMTFLVKAPLFVRSQWFRHRIACLTGDTLVTFVNTQGDTSNKLKFSIKELHDKWNLGQDSHNSPTGKRDFKSRLSKMRLRVLNEDTKEFTTGNIVNVVYNGDFPVYKVTLSCGKVIKMTMNHKCYTDKGWLTLESAIEEKAKFYVSGKATELVSNLPEYSSTFISGYDNRYSVDTLGVVRTFINTRGVRLSDPRVKKPTKNKNGRYVVSLNNKALQVSRLVAKAFIPNPNNKPFVLHKDGNPENNKVNNLYWGDDLENKADKSASAGNDSAFVSLSDLLEVEYVGVEPTYDISVSKPYHNFLANGIVVHNSYNEISARYVEVKEEFYVPQKFRKQSTSNRQASEGIVDNHEGIKANYTYYKNCLNSVNAYNELLGLGVCREQARAVLPQAMYTEFYYTTNLRSLLNFIKLRSHNGAQWEIVQYAKAITEIVREIFPETFKAWEELNNG